MPASTWDTPSFKVSHRLKPVKPRSLEAILTDIDAAGVKLAEAEEQYTDFDASKG